MHNPRGSAPHHCDGTTPSRLKDRYDDRKDRDLTIDERDVLSGVSIAGPWSLVECFAHMRREHPTEMNRGGEEIAARLSRLGIPAHATSRRCS